MRRTVRCRDGYEAQKLASMILDSKLQVTFIREILNVFGTEVVVSLMDKSAHSIVMADDIEVENLVDLMQPVLDGTCRITRVAVSGSSIGIHGVPEGTPPSDE